MHTSSDKDHPTAAAPVVPSTIRGTDGSDILLGGAADDLIDAGAGDDYLYDDQGSNALRGGPGDDTIIGAGIIHGGPGDDTIAAAGDASGNIYQYALGDGFDTISTMDGRPSLSELGTLRFGAGVTPAAVALVRDDDHLSFYLGPTDQVTLLDWFKGPAFQLAQVDFADGTTWRPDDIAAMDIAVLGTEGDDVLQGHAGNNLIHAGSGDDYVLDGEGNNVIYGGAGDDSLMGRGVLDGGHGNDTLMAVGQAEHNIYFFDVGDGHDTLYAQGDENPGRAQGTVGFGETLDPSRLWFRRQDDDLAVTVVGSREGLTIKDWYRGEPNQVARFMAGDDRVLRHDQVQDLVHAMAAFAPPLSGASRLEHGIGLALAPVLAASWS
ncbi:calcium-binding protein [Herbaspirillum sp. YR522]|uniref:calcium-binding protein n=1 Tax=Herbaspirillum sp. YR522 TaxID=1144342 RepID=UPI00026F5C86|nr:calcium-binding protein [Herbaspirillum sp. YR522]EJN03799.1 hemolysin-type calcium-binding protein [Herbaspirillum sp. YR522]